MLGGDQRPHLGLLVEWVADAQPFHRLLQGLHEAVDGCGLDEDPRARAAVLTRVAEHRRRRRGRGLLEVGVGEHDVGRLAAQLQGQRLIDSAASAPMRLPTSVDPVNATLATSACRTSRSPTVLPAPTTTLSTPSGMPACRARRSSSSAVSGVRPAGFKTMVLPAASAGPTFHDVIAIGKFQGTI